VTASRRRSARYLGRGLLAVLLAGGILTACGGGPPPAPQASQGIVENRVVPGTIPLVDPAGRVTNLAAYRGKYIVLAPFLSLCQDECPLVTGAFIALQHDVRAAGLGQQVVFMEITVDPRRDTPARLAAYAARFGADWPLFTGTPADLDELWKFFGVSHQVVPEAQPPELDWWTGKPLTYDVDHTDGYILIDRQGRERFVDATPPNLHGQLDKGLTGLLNAGGRQNLYHQTGNSWTLSEALASLEWLVGRPLPSAAAT
jgi:cytochrome oxidase Cu insertion factor (SCO1/SenC/PrrC family)